MLRTVETLHFGMIESCPDASPGRTYHQHVPVAVVITTRRNQPDHGNQSTPIGPRSDSRLSLTARCVIAERIGDKVNGHDVDQPLFPSVSASHNPEALAIWAYNTARHIAGGNPECTDSEIIVESVRVMICSSGNIGDTTYEYAQTAGA